MADRALAEILSEITACEIAGDQPDRLAALKQEVYDHPGAAAGRDLPPIVGVIGG